MQDARKARDEARNQLEEGIDPVEEKRQRKLEAEMAAKTTFKLVADEYIQKIERETAGPRSHKGYARQQTWSSPSALGSPRK
ncbi:hypothetical protein [Rhizorhabdus argentea]|uniref:hypothetical protein n=1 Tax=Rhizorhabdus argentea TaxID=1387174 RepID=UPI0030EB522F